MCPQKIQYEVSADFDNLHHNKIWVLTATFDDQHFPAVSSVSTSLFSDDGQFPPMISVSALLNCLTSNHFLTKTCVAISSTLLLRSFVSWSF